MKAKYFKVVGIVTGICSTIAIVHYLIETLMLIKSGWGPYLIENIIWLLSIIFFGPLISFLCFSHAKVLEKVFPKENEPLPLKATVDESEGKQIVTLKINYIDYSTNTIIRKKSEGIVQSVNGDTLTVQFVVEGKKIVIIDNKNIFK